MFNFSRENTGAIAKWWRNVDKQILFLFIFLFFLGLLFSFSSTSSVISEKMNKETYFFFKRHLTFVFIALFLLIIISVQEKNKIIKFILPIFAISILFSLLFQITYPIYNSILFNNYNLFYLFIYSLAVIYIFPA